jgi:hypothetical protein
MYAWESELGTLSGLSDQAASDAINDMTIVVPIVPRYKIKSYLYSQGCYAKMLESLDSADVPTKGLIQTVLAFLIDPDFENLDLSLPDVRIILNSLKTAGILTEKQHTDIFMMQTTQLKYMPRATDHQVAEVRSK